MESEVRFHASRLSRVVDLKTDKQIPIMETVYRSGKEGEPTEVQRGNLQPRELRKLKGKAIFSLRGDLIAAGGEDLARHILE